MGEVPAVVFVIDDDPSMRASLEDLVGSVGLEVRSFASPQEFLESEQRDTARRPSTEGTEVVEPGLEPRSGTPSCLVLDVRLPGMSGLTFQKELVKAGSRFPSSSSRATGTSP
jgi:FixJ family two-component response regulator